MKPIIALLTEVDDERMTKVRCEYVDAVEDNGGIPIILPYVYADETVMSYIRFCDGFLFTGGADVNPEYYGEQMNSSVGAIQKYRDEFEFKILSEILKTKKPILAICRGAQLLNVALGGSLYQDIPSEIQTTITHKQKEPHHSPSHSVNVTDNAPLKELTRVSVFPANSFHHQAIKTLGENLKVMALADDGVIEALYCEGDRYIRAYQWHPERLYKTNEYNRAIFTDFINNCAMKKN